MIFLYSFLYLFDIKKAREATTSTQVGKKYFKKALTSAETEEEKQEVCFYNLSFFL
jgi:hypothetical protein